MRRLHRRTVFLLAGLALASVSCHSSDDNNVVKPLAHTACDPVLGQEVFRYETFGNEGFWTRVAQLPQGMIEAGVTPIMALKAGLSVDIEKVPAAMIPILAAELKTDLSPLNAPALNSVATTEALVEANAVIGFAAKNVKALNGKLDIDANNIYAGESVGATCALCHGITDASIYSLPGGGTIGKRVDGPTNHNLNVGAILALAKQSRAFYPMLALNLAANGGKSVSRKGPGIGLISANPSEAEVDAYLNDPLLYPIGMFDDAVDGNGAPMHITPFFRTDLAAPWGSEGSIEMLHNFGNLVYSGLFDLTSFTTVGGKKFLNDRGGAAGLEISANYEAILATLGVAAGGENGYPFVARAGRPDVTLNLAAGAKVEASPLGIQVNQTKLIAMNGYLNTLHSPVGDKSDPAAIARGQALFNANCTSCHNASQSVFVPQNIVPFNNTVELFAAAPARPAIWPAYAGEFAADRSASGLAPVRNSPGTFDDKMVIVDASNRGQPRGVSFPLLMDLARKPVFLHDDSVKSLDELLNPARGANEPHPFYIPDAQNRADVISVLKSFDDRG